MHAEWVWRHPLLGVGWEILAKVLVKEFLNTELESKGNMEGETNEGLVNKITEIEVNQSLKRMKKNRVLQPNDIPIEI